MVAKQQPPPRFDDADSDGDVPPPPPAENFEDHSRMVSYDESTSFMDESSAVQSTPSTQWRILKQEAKHALVPQDDPLTNRPNAPTNVPMQGHFRGIQSAQDFDEEEAGMVEIEVPSSSVVARMNNKEATRTKRAKLIKFVLIGTFLVAAIAAIAGGISAASKPNGIAGVQRAADAGDGDTQSNPVPNPTDPADLVNTPAGRFASTIAPLDNEHTAAALDWIANDPANAAYNFDDEASFDDPETQFNFKQRFAAATLFSAFQSGNTEDDAWVNSDGWMSDADVCDWHGIACGDYEGRRRMVDVDSNVVTKIDLSKNNIAGGIPPQIALFEDVDTILLEHNWFTGPIPEEMFGMTQLIDLDLYDNLLTGELSPEIGALVNLQVLYLGLNRFEGDIPSSVEDLQSLSVAWLDNNMFSGNIPNFPESIVELDLKENTLVGQIPESLTTSANLEKLDLSANWLTGQLPAEYSPSLTEFRVNDNILSGAIPNTLGELDGLEILHLFNNVYDDTDGPTGAKSEGFTDFIPSNFSELPSLRELRLENNDLQGQIFDLQGGICSRDDVVINAFCGDEDCSGDECCECALYQPPKGTK